jgi:hypothetical protein
MPIDAQGFNHGGLRMQESGLVSSAARPMLQLVSREKRLLQRE